MKKFSDFGLTLDIKAFTGEKIKIKKILNTEITVFDYRIEDSKFEGKCLYIQIEKGKDRHVVFTSSKYLTQALERIDKPNFPFITTIVEVDERFEFT